MRAHSPLAHLFPTSAHPATTRGHTLAAPRFYDVFANVFFFGRRQATFGALIAAARVQPGQRVLDVGCGTGYFARMLARSVGTDGRVVGVDASPEMIQYASRHASVDHVKNLRFQIGAAESLAFPDQHFDVAVSSLFIHHLPADLQLTAVRELSRVLRPGGTLLLADARIPSTGPWHLLAAFTGHLHMAEMVPPLGPLTAQAGFTEIRGGDAPPWLTYVVGVKRDSVD
jgi:ubiquinone/menaquinone biosynthesis C-methylase UbiE